MVSRGRARLSFDEGEAVLADTPTLVGLINAASDPGERQRFVELLRRCGALVAGPDVTRSGRDWEMHANARLAEGKIGERGGSRKLVVRCGLRQIGALSPELIDRIIAVRRSAGYADAFDFLERALPRESELSSLVRSGALDALSEGLTRPQLLWLLTTAKREGQRPLFPRQLPRCLKDYAPESKRRDERQAFGLSIREEPEEVSAASAVPPQP